MLLFSHGSATCLEAQAHCLTCSVSLNYEGKAPSNISPGYTSQTLHFHSHSGEQWPRTVPFKTFRSDVFKAEFPANILLGGTWVNFRIVPIFTVEVGDGACRVLMRH